MKRLPMKPVVEGYGLLRREGARYLGQRIVRRIYQQSGAAQLEFPLTPGDVADPHRMKVEVPTSRPQRGASLDIGWVCTPPSGGSGGHTTMFRMIEALEACGHNCVLYLYDRFGGLLDRHSEVVRKSWPNVRAQVRDVSEGISNVDALVATSWQSAHVIATRDKISTRRCYFIQDFEPFFYPRGSLYELAAASYQLGFKNITLGRMVADQLAGMGVESEVVPFGCDNEIYSLLNTVDRRGVVFYAKPDVPRRGYVLAKFGLEQFHRRHPEHPIHVYGDGIDQVSFPVVHHSQLTPKALNVLYNESVAGLAMSFTNISLVAEEMLASGTIPIVNDSTLARADLDNRHAAWATPTAGGIADALSGVVEHPDIIGRAIEAASSVRHGWSATGAEVVRIIENEVFGSERTT